MDDRLNDAPCGFITLNSSGVIVEVNNTLIALLQYERDSLIGRHIESMLSIANKMFFHTYFYPYIQLYGEVNEMYFSIQSKDGKNIPVLLNGIRRQRNHEEVIECVVMVMRKRIEYEQEIRLTMNLLEELLKEKELAHEQLQGIQQEYERKQEELLRVNQHLQEIAWTDALTGLKNRRYIQGKLVEQFLLYRETQLSFSIMLLDIDRFKSINDTYGHPAGDQILVKLAGIIKKESRGMDHTSRYGGEEFMVILPNTNAVSSVLAAERYRESVERATWDTCRVTVSIGVATVMETDNEHSLVERADQALYAAKRNGRNCVIHASMTDKL